MINIGTKKINTDRLILKRFELEDSEEIFNNYVNDADFIKWSNKRKITLQEEVEYLKNATLKYTNNTYYNWAIYSKEKHCIIGAIRLSNVNLEDESVELNYVIGQKFTNNGYMTEALKAVISFCFNDIKLKKVYGICAIDNVASKCVMEKSGMHKESRLNNFLNLHNEWHDCYLYSIVNEDNGI